MGDIRTAESVLEAAAGAADPEATETFALLADETRLAILLVLWEAYEPYTEDKTMSFSELYERVEYDSPGNFSYHLEKLEDQFIRQTDDGGYELRITGLKLVQTLIAGSGVKDKILEPAEIDRDCWLCGAPTALTYQDGVAYLICTDCEGESKDQVMPDGYLSAMKFDPAGLSDRTPEEICAATAVAAWRHMQTMFDGLCPTCSGPVDAWLEHCTDHDQNDRCENCGRTFATWARFQCRVCEDFHATSLATLVLFHPATVSFYDDHGISMRLDATDFESVRRIGDLVFEHEMALVSEDPLRVEVIAAVDGDELRLTFDETVSVVDVNR
jgi:DNA-binding transcriptional ArsR family regulator